MILSFIAGKRMLAEIEIARRLKKDLPQINRYSQAFLPEDCSEHKQEFIRAYENAQYLNFQLIARIAPEKKITKKHMENFTNTMCSNDFKRIVEVDFGTEVGVLNVCEYNYWQYIDYYRIAYPILKKANKIITAPGFTMINDDFFDMFENFCKFAAKEKMLPDRLAAHFYDPLEHRAKMLNKCLEIAAKYHLPFVITETGFNIEGKRWYECTKNNAIKRQVKDSINWVFHCERLVYEMFWYQIRNDSAAKHYYGLWDDNWNFTNLYYAFKDRIFPFLAGPPA